MHPRFVPCREQLHRVQYEAEMRIQMINEKMRSQEESRRQALVSNERKREFLRYILHEIRVPLNALVLGLEGLKTSVETSTSSGEQQGGESSNDTSSLTTHRTPTSNGRVQEELVEEEEEEQEEQEEEQQPRRRQRQPHHHHHHHHQQQQQQQQQQHDDEKTSEADSGSRASCGGQPFALPGSPHRSPLPSPTLERSPVLFSNSSILPLTTSLSRASSLALSASSSASSASGQPSPVMAASHASLSAAAPATLSLCEEDVDSINEMWHAVSHMTRLLDDVLSLQRIEDGELLLERRAFSLPDTCMGAVRMMSTWLDNKGLAVQCDVDSSLPILSSDEYRVRQVLINFLSNAIRFTPGRSDSGSEGRIVLTVKRCDRFDSSEPIIEEGQSDEMKETAGSGSDTKSIQPAAPHPPKSPRSSDTSSSDVVASSTATSSSSSNTPPLSPSRVYVRVAVHDTGIGIPLSDLQRMFTPFVQISSGEAEKGKGTGLGLSICRKLIDLLGGRVGVISAPGQGSTFFFEAPFDVSADQNPEALRPADALAASGAVNADEASSRTINRPASSDDTPTTNSSPQLITSSLRNKRRAMHNRQKSSSNVNYIPLHPAHPASLALAASSQQTVNTPTSPVRMVARALTVPPAPSSTRPAPPSTSSLAAAASATALITATVAVSPKRVAAPVAKEHTGGDGSSSVGAVAAPAPVAGSASRVARSSAAKRPLRVLVVDDADSNRKLLARLVSRDGAAVCEQARDGQEAVNMVQDDVTRFDTILCDKVQFSQLHTACRASAHSQTSNEQSSHANVRLRSVFAYLRRCLCWTGTALCARCAVWACRVPSSE